MTASLDEIIQSWQSSIPDAMECVDVTGLAIGVCDRDGPVWSAGFGSTARVDGSPVTPTTRFSVQSTSKLITAGVVLTAVGRGLVDLDEPIARYLPDFRINSSFEDDPASSLTLRHLLSHTGGFTHEAPVGSNYVLGTGDFEDHCRSIYDTWLRFPVGQHFEYSNLGIDLAALAVQQVCGESLARQANDVVLAPIGATGATFDPSVIVDDSNSAIGHWRPFTEAEKPLPVVVPMQPSGGLYASVDDILRVVAMHLRGGAPVLDRAQFAEHYRIPFAPAEQRLGYALGVFVDEWDGTPVRHHGDSGFGFQCQVCWVPSAGLGVAVLTNCFDHELDDELAHRFVADVAAESVEAERVEEPLTPSSDVPDELLGEYLGRLDSMRVAVEHGRLTIATGKSAYPARLIAGRTIEVGSPVPERFTFVPRADGSIGYLRSLRVGWSTYYRNDPDGVGPSRLPARAEGHYASSVFGVPFGHYVLEQEGESPVLRQILRSGSVCTARLNPLDHDRFISTTGEILDHTGEHPSYANIPLVPKQFDER